MDKLGLRHWWLKTPSLEAGMGKRGGGVPGLATTQNPYTLRTTMNDHSGQSQDPSARCQPVCGVSLERVEVQMRQGRETGAWLPLVNDCNNVVDDILKTSGGDPRNWPGAPLHADAVHSLYQGTVSAIDRVSDLPTEVQMGFSAWLTQMGVPPL
jgi:hypothetical protein